MSWRVPAWREGTLLEGTLLESTVLGAPAWAPSSDPPARRPQPGCAQFGRRAFSDGAGVRTTSPRDFQRFSEILFWAIFGLSQGALGAHLLPECSPRPWLNFGRVSAKSAPWRPHSWPKIDAAKPQNSAKRVSLRDFSLSVPEFVRTFMFF